MSKQMPNNFISFADFSTFTDEILPKNVIKIPKYKNQLPSMYFDNDFLYSEFDTGTKIFSITTTDQNGAIKKEFNITNLPHDAKCEVIHYNPQTDVIWFLQKVDKKDHVYILSKSFSQKDISIRHFDSFIFDEFSMAHSKNKLWFLDRVNMFFKILDLEKTTITDVPAPLNLDKAIKFSPFGHLIAIEDRLIFVQKTDTNVHQLVSYQIGNNLLKEVWKTDLPSAESYSLWHGNRFEELTCTLLEGKDHHSRYDILDGRKI